VLYNELAAMLLNELQRQERTIQKQQGTIDQLQGTEKGTVKMLWHGKCCMLWQRKVL
jgi:hypothetical protein